jgi:epsin
LLPFRGFDSIRFNSSRVLFPYTLLYSLSHSLCVTYPYYSFNQAKPKTEVEARVYEVLSHKNWGASGSLLNEIARDTYDYEKFAIISQLTWESLENQRPAAWRVVFKGLTLLEHLVKNGSERCVDDARNHGHTLRALKQFNYYEGTIDRGSGVREKVKQMMEILSDDERIREERQKAKQLQQKFGAKMSGVSSTGNTSGGGGGSSGYGQNNWDSRGGNGGGGGGGGGGYGDGGIDSERSKGRYDDKDTRPSAAAGPTFAAMPDEPRKIKTKKTKKKKKADFDTGAPAPEAASVDLFSFDDPTPVPVAAATSGGDDFAAFQSAGGGAPPAVHDPFAEPAAAPQQSAQFDAFQQAAPAQQTAQFDAFGGQSMGGGNTGMGGGSAMNNNSYAMGGGNTGMGGGGSAMNNNSYAMGGGMNGNGNGMMQQGGDMNGNGMMQQGQMQTGGMGMNQSSMAPMGGMAQKQQRQQQPPPPEEDEFGDFSDAPSQSKQATGSTDPLSKLISLDGLSKNPGKQESKINQPIIANTAAATFVQEKEVIQANMQQNKKGSSMSFAGIDGLHNNRGMMSQMGNMPPVSSVGSNPSVMGNSGASSIGMMMDPQSMQSTQRPQQQQGGMMGNQQGNQQGMMGNQQGMMGNQQGMMGNQQGMMGNQQGMMGNQQGMMGNQQGMMGGNMRNQQGGMNNGGMMNQQQQQMMNQQMGGGMQGNMGNNMNMQGNTGGQQGGNDMSGWR